MTLEVSDSTRQDYAARVNRVIDHLEAHLGEPLDLPTLARVACFSPFHFHRLFRAWTGEPLSAYVQRLRLEQAANQLGHQRRKPITEIALDCGFGSASAFARAFRAHHGCTASEWRDRQFRKLDQGARKGGTAEPGAGTGNFSPSGRSRAMEASVIPVPLTVRIEDMPDLTLAYVRHMGAVFNGPELFPRLVRQVRAWAGGRELLGPDTPSMLIYADNPEVTPEDRQRLDVAVAVPTGTVAEGEVGVKVLPGGRWAMARIDITPDQYETAWRTFLADWLPGSGWELDDRTAMQITRQPPGVRHIADLCLPVRPQ